MKQAVRGVDGMISFENKESSVIRGTIIDITNSKSGWFEVWLGNEKLYIDTVTGKDGKEHFNLIELNDEELLTNDEWNER